MQKFSERKGNCKLKLFPKKDYDVFLNFQVTVAILTHFWNGVYIHLTETY